MNKRRRIGAMATLALVVSVIGGTTASAYLISPWFTYSDEYNIDGCNVVHILGVDHVRGYERPTCPRDVGVRAIYRVGTSYYTGALVWDVDTAIKFYTSNEDPTQVKVYHGNH